jgi:tRNA(Arg) A34 adenosine deaminase TadA
VEENFEQSVEKMVERLKFHSPQMLEREVAQKRIAWINQQKPRLNIGGSMTPRQAFELLFFRYMGLDEADLPVTFESSTEIAWRSLNPCPTLEAAIRLGLDTRQVCRSIYEKSTQAFLSQLDPRLRFLRNYARIRPYVDACEERIVLVNFEKMMQLAVEEARLSRQDGNKGYGAVVGMGDRVIATAHDTATTDHDPSLHAELNAMRKAVLMLGNDNLTGAILYSTCEPCPMCSSLAVWANLTTLVYGVSIEETAGLGKARIRVSAKLVAERAPGMLEIIGGVLREVCLQLYT